VAFRHALAILLAALSRRARLGLALAACSLLAGCSLFRPMLEVKEVDAMPNLNTLLNLPLWQTAKPLTVTVRRGHGSTLETRQVQLRAISDGRMLSIMVVWHDDVRTLERQAWVWDKKADAYKLEVVQPDCCALEWPLTPGADFQPFDSRPASYDAWLWQAGWSDVSGYADDLRLNVEVYPPDASPASVDVPLYPSIDGKARVAHRWIPGQGVPGTQATPRPTYFQKNRMSGAQAAYAPAGSAANVRARSLYKVFQGGMPNSWLLKDASRDDYGWSSDANQEADEGYWLVEYQRALRTADKQNDYQITGPGPHRFAVAICDNAPWAMQFVSGPILLKMFR
jgi:hypothetical protein